jgi:ATP-dependent DNA ligase
MAGPISNRMRACFSHQGAPEAFLYAFDLLELDGRDLRNEPWARRRAELVQLLAGADDGIRLSEHIEDADGRSCSDTGPIVESISSSC